MEAQLTEQTTVEASRRDFLRLASVGAATAGAAAVASAPALAAEEAPETPGYRKTKHIEAYLETCRF